MKTILKFLALIAVGVGLVVGAFSLMNGDTIDPEPVVSDASYTELNNRIEATYNNGVLTEWNKETYASIYGSIVSSSRNNYIDQYDRNSLINKLRIYASRQLEVILKNEYAKSDCKREDIRRLINDGIEEVAKGWDYQSEDTDKVIERHRTVHQLYGNILAFGSRTHSSFEPNVREKSGMIVWKPLREHTDKINQKRKEYLANTYYKQYLSNITAVKNALLESKMEKNYKMAADGYPNEVKKAIINYFSKLTPDAENAKLYKDAVSEFGNQFHQIPAYDELMFDYNTFNARVPKEINPNLGRFRLG